jgi:hypothetical protein
MKYYISRPPMNPISRFVAALFAVAATLGMFFFGLIILAVLIGLFGLFALGLWIRSWWLRRQIGEAPVERTSTGQEGGDLEAEYTVVSRRRS